MKFNSRDTMFVTCAKEMPAYLMNECRSIGVDIVKQHEAGVELYGSLNDAMRLNLYLRTAHRILFLLGKAKINDSDQLYDYVSSIPWEDIIDANGYFSVSGAIRNDTVNDTRFPLLKCKDAIVDRIRKAKGTRPFSGPRDDKSVVFIYWEGDDFKVYIDTSGESLSRRGYRKIPMKAPMQETLAAGVLIASEWDRSSPLINPMCGSGTIAIEAALMAINRAPGVIRKNFGFMHILGYERFRWDDLLLQARNSERNVDVSIIASDISSDAIQAAKKNADMAGVSEKIRFQVCDFRNTDMPAGKGVVILNPEYGERMGDAASLEPEYRAIGDFFKQKCLGLKCFIFTGNLDLAKKVGLRSSSRKIFYNSSIECRLLGFEVYAGTRRNKFLNDRV